MHLESDTLLEGVEVEVARSQSVLGAVRRGAPVLRCRRRVRQCGSTLLRPEGPLLGVGIRNLDVDEQRSSRLELRSKASKRLLVLGAGAPEPERAAHVDRAVAPRKVELVHRLDVQGGREALGVGLLAARGDHVGRYVAAVYVEPGSEVGQEQPTAAAADIERRLAAVLDEALEVRDLVR